MREGGSAGGMKLSVIGYWRVSSDRQGREGVSLDDQAAAGRRWCEAHGAELAAQFVEDESAWTKRGRRRPALEEALAFIRRERGRVRYFLVYDLSRFARSLFDQLAVQRELAELGVQLQTVTLHLEDNAHGRAVAGYLGVTNQLQSDLASEKIQRCMLEVTRRGRLPHAAPIGYRNTRDAEGRKAIDFDPDRAPLVREAFEMTAAGAAPLEVLRALTARGFRSRRGKTMRPQELRKLLKNRFYLGVVVSHKHNFEAPGVHPPLVDAGLFARVQQRLGARDESNRARRAIHPDFPLRGFVRCEACGKPLTASYSRGKSGRRYGWYRCWWGECGKARVRASDLEAAFVDRLDRMRVPPATAARVERVLAELWRREQTGAADVRAQLERQLAEARRRRERLVEAFVYDRAIDRETYDRQLERLDVEIHAANLELSWRADVAGELEQLLAFARPLLTDTSEIWRKADTPLRRRLQALVFPRGAIFGNAGLGTPEEASIFRGLRAFETEEVRMVELSRDGCAHLGAWLAEAGAIVRAVAGAAA